MSQNKYHTTIDILSVCCVCDIIKDGGIGRFKIGKLKEVFKLCLMLTVNIIAMLVLIVNWNHLPYPFHS